MITRWGPFTSCAKCGHSPHPGTKCGPPAESAGTQPEPTATAFSVPEFTTGEPTDEQLLDIELSGASLNPRAPSRSGRRALYRAGVASQAARVTELESALRLCMEELDFQDHSGRPFGGHAALAAGRKALGEK